MLEKANQQYEESVRLGDKLFLDELFRVTGVKVGLEDITREHVRGVWIEGIYFTQQYSWVNKVHMLPRCADCKKVFSSDLGDYHLVRGLPDVAVFNKLYSDRRCLKCSFKKLFRK